MPSFFLAHPLGTFLVGLVLGGCAMGGAAAFYRHRLHRQMDFTIALLSRPDLYRRVRDGQWLEYHRAAVERDLAEAHAAHVGRPSGG